MTRKEFVDYLRSTLIPDLIESGSTATAADFTAACLFIEGASEVSIDGDDVTVIR